MKYWNKIRQAVDDYKGASMPRDMFESLIGQYDDYIDHLEAKLNYE